MKKFTLIATAVAALAMLAVASFPSPSQAQTVVPRLVSSATVDSTLFEINNRDNELLVALRGEAGLVGTSLNGLTSTLVLQDRFGYWGTDDAATPSGVLSSPRAVVVNDHTGFTLEFRPGQSMWLSMLHGPRGAHQLRALGNDHITYLLEGPGFGIFEIYPDSGGIDDEWVLSDRESGHLLRMNAIEVLGDLVFIALDERIIVSDLSNRSDPDILGEVSDMTEIAGVPGVQILEAVSSDMIWAATQSEVFVIVSSPRGASVITKLDLPRVVDIRANVMARNNEDSGLVAVTTVTGVRIFQIAHDGAGHGPSNPLPIAELPGDAFTGAEISRLGLLITTEVRGTSASMKVWDLEVPAIAPTPTPTRTLLDRIVGKAYLPMVRNHAFHLESPGLRPFNGQLQKLPSDAPDLKMLKSSYHQPR